MTRPSDLTPTRYEVIRLTTGQEMVGMTRELSDQGIEITLPMICHLTVQPSRSTLATFYPYAPLSGDSKVILPWDIVAHRNLLNPQFIDLYDSASSQWLTMIENGSIPLVETRPDQVAKDFKSIMDNKIRKIVDRLDDYSAMDDDDALDIEEVMKKLYDPITDEEEFRMARPPKDKKKFH